MLCTRARPLLFGEVAYATSTSTTSESPIAVILTEASLRMAAPSRALTRTPLTSTAPTAAGERNILPISPRVLSGEEDAFIKCRFEMAGVALARSREHAGTARSHLIA